MSASLLQACWAGAVTLALYAFYCYWEAGRADLAASFRHLVPGCPARRGPTCGGKLPRPGAMGGHGSLLALGCLSSVL